MWSKILGEKRDIIFEAQINLATSVCSVQTIFQDLKHKKDFKSITRVISLFL